MVEARLSFETFVPEKAEPLFDSMKKVNEMVGRGLLQQVGDMVHYGFWRNVQEYYALGVWRAVARDPGLQGEYIGTYCRRKLNKKLNRFSRFSNLVDDKILHAELLAGMGVGVPQLQAIFHPHRRVGQSFTLKSSADIVEFLRQKAHYPLFGKPIQGSLSLGALSIEHYDAARDVVHLLGGSEISTERLAEEITAQYPRTGYIFQTRIAQNEAINRICGQSVAAVRVATLHDHEAIRPLYAVWKIPALHAPADNFWRAGNMVAALDPATGGITRVQIGSGTRAREIDTHPDTGERLLGYRLPEWNKVLEAVRLAAELTPDVRIIGWDIAIGRDGPVIIEGNASPDHGLFQIAHSRGLMTPEFVARLEMIACADKERVYEVKRDRKSKKRAALARKFEAYRRQFDFENLGKPTRP